LEEAGLVRRERDPNDGRKVIVQLASNKNETQKIGPIFDSIAKAWNEMASGYNDEQIAFLLEFLKHSNAVSRQEIIQLREAPAGGEGIFSAPLGELERGQLVVSSGLSRLTLRAGEAMTALYQARFEGPVPDIKAKDGLVSIRYPNRLWVLGGGQRAAEVMLSAAIPWRIVIQGGAAEVEAKLDGLDLTGLEVKGGLNTIHLELPVPSSVVPIRIKGGASEVTIRRPAGVAARVHLKGWASEFVFDDQIFSGVGNDVRLQSPDYKITAPCYDIEVASSASSVTITSG
jgi:hypothetical protein